MHPPTSPPLSLTPSPPLGCSPLFFLVLTYPISSSFLSPHLCFFLLLPRHQCPYTHTHTHTHTNSYTCSGCLTSSRQLILDQHVRRTGVGGRILKASVEETGLRLRKKKTLVTSWTARRGLQGSTLPEVGQRST